METIVTGRAKVDGSVCAALEEAILLRGEALLEHELPWTLGRLAR